MTTHLLRISRRRLMKGALVLAGASALPGAWAVNEAPQPVLTFHLDGLVIDQTGKSPPYRPPKGLRSAVPTQHLGHHEIRWLQGWA